MIDYDPYQYRRWMKDFKTRLGLLPVGDTLTMGHITDAMRYALESSMYGGQDLTLPASTFKGLSKMLGARDKHKNKRK